jgi:hypothetical protein
VAELHTFNAQYVPHEDRILLQAVGDGWNQNFWITRRVLILLGGVFQTLLDKHYTETAQQMSGSAAYAADFAEFARDASLNDNPPQPAQALEALTDPPILVYEIKYLSLGQGVFAIMLTDTNGNGHGYQLQEALLQALLNLLQAQADQAVWNVRLTNPITATTAPSAPVSKRLLN